MTGIDYDEFHGQTAPPATGGVQTLMTWAGALTSVALVAGLGIWGYQLTMRDVSGVPVVRALEGPMRVAPDDPGGRQADHQGLAVNRVTAEGEAAPPADRLMLAPRPVDLTDEDAPRASLKPAPRTVVVEASIPADDSLIEPKDPVALALARAEKLSRSAAPIELIPEDDEITAPPALSLTGDTAPDDTTTAVSGVTYSIRPRARPEGDLAALAAIAAATAATGTPAEVELASNAVAAGTNLVQLGAFDSPDIARAEWQRLSSRFSSLMDGKQRLVQSAVSGGRTFYRLRAVGFADISDARRFCAALTAENADCIPVVAR